MSRFTPVGPASNSSPTKKQKNDSVEGSVNTKSAQASQRNHFRIILTGGPCGGKSSALEYLRKHFEKKGYSVFTVPEVPTIMMVGGCKYPGVEKLEKLLEFESALISAQMAMENAFSRIADSRSDEGSGSLVIMDRGILDVKAYVTPDVWNKILAENNWTDSGLLNRYDAVIHLVTTADGAEEFYTRSNNAARTETAEQARELDQKVRRCWEKATRFQVIDNSTAFDQKIARTIESVEQFLAN